MLFNIRMRAAQGGAHEKGGRHISGAERLLPKEELPQTAEAMLTRALTHSKGEADFIRLTVDAVQPQDIKEIPCLTIAQTKCTTVAEAHSEACRLLSEQIRPEAVTHALETLLALPQAMRGAMLVNAVTGERLDTLGDRGVRVSRMGFQDQTAAIANLKKHGYDGIHLQEALVLASKVLSSPDIYGELCISDDPEYVTGYVSYKQTYHRLSPMKPMGSPFGGRIFFVNPTADLNALQTYLEQVTTVVGLPPLPNVKNETSSFTTTPSDTFINQSVQEMRTYKANPSEDKLTDAKASLSIFDDLADELEQLKSTHTYRHLTTYAPQNGAHASASGKDYLMMTTNNYLGLAQSKALREAAQTAVTMYGTGSGGSRLLSGSFPLFSILEKKLAQLKETEKALVFNTGYMANVGIITALMGKKDHILSDALNHASIIDGCRLSRANLHVYQHNDPHHLESLLKTLPSHGRRLIITDGVFSMDGDIAPLPELLDIAQRYDALLMVDDAHATGVIGDGRGTAHHFGLADERLIQVGTLSKAIGAEGGFVCASELLIAYFINKARSFIFSTALTPADIGAAVAAVDLLLTNQAPVKRLQENVMIMAHTLASHGIDVPEKIKQGKLLPNFAPTPIFPIMVGSADKALAIAQALYEEGIILSAIRPPTVAPHTSRLRLTVTADHTAEELKRAAALLGQHL